MAKNISKVYLMNVPLEDDLKNTIYFSNPEAQQAYFPKNFGYTNVSYQAETRTFRCPSMIDNIRQYNYLMWQNPAYSNKWFYAFIKKLTYFNDGYTDVEFEVDPFQTYMFDYTVMPSFIEREHTNNDTIGNNTLPEGLELGEYVKNQNTQLNTFGKGTMWYAVAVSDIIGTMTKYPAAIVNNVPTGLYYILTDTVSMLHGIVQMYDIAGKANAIYSMFTFPKEILNISGSYAYQASTWNYENGSFSTTKSVYVPTSSNRSARMLEEYVVCNKPSKIGKTYTPRNNKLFTFPYCYFNISNNAGTVVTYHYEDFNGNPKFNLRGTLGIGCSTRLYPVNYKGMDYYSDYDNAYDYGLSGAKYPTISWNSDSYTNWLTQNSLNIGLSAGQTVLNTSASLAVGNVAGATLSFLGGVTSAVGEVYKASLMPDQAKGNTNCCDVNYVDNKNGFTCYPLSIKPEYAAIIDNYFDVFGYKTNLVKYPNVAHRENWWYTKTINANVVGNIPNEYVTKIKEAYDNGITFWRNPNNFLDYTVSNGIV